MSTIFLTSYIVLWLLVVPLVILNLILFRQLGIMVMGTARGVNESGIPIGKKLPYFESEELDGVKWNLGQELGKPSLFLFISPRCNECKKILPDFLKISSMYNVSPILVIFADKVEAAEYINKIGFKGRSLSISHEQALPLDVSATPFAYAINSDGIVQEKGLVNTQGHIERYVKSVANKAA
ncbi:methylamine dehydrogenase [Bacillus sp. V3-13]|uniref:methylamine dehydrogenase n=1 Tax=Bacillus sp. V3-13 TaxID=2053728 RepID=UPI000C778ABA|nr:methylamine dehydrogenase [Bacillus sp. V3-13]PLR77934.1 methylamine dehydrogenase [Bacillus sp. V3-13]